MRPAMTCLMLVLGSLLLAGCEQPSAEAAPTGDASHVGKLCEVVLDAQWLQAHTGYVTPGATRDNVNGSKGSAWGRLVRVSDDWVVLEAANIRMDVEDGRTTTYGKAGETDHFEFWIPRSKILYMRVWTDEN